jgi:hypothetical protein
MSIWDRLEVWTRRTRTLIFSHSMGEIRTSSLPPKNWSNVSFGLTRFRWEFMALNYSRGAVFGISYEWLGISVKLYT